MRPASSSWPRCAAKPGRIHYNGAHHGWAGVAQLAEQLSCKQQVGGSNPLASSMWFFCTQTRFRAGFGSKSKHGIVIQYIL